MTGLVFKTQWTNEENTNQHPTFFMTTAIILQNTVYDIWKDLHLSLDTFFESKDHFTIRFVICADCNYDAIFCPVLAIMMQDQ